MAEERKLQSCYVADAAEYMPPNAQCVSLKFIRDPAVDIHSPSDVLELVCKKMFSQRHTYVRLCKVVQQLKPSWLIVNDNWKNMLCNASRVYSVKLGGAGIAPILRAARVLEWGGCSRTYARITYCVPGAERVAETEKVTESQDAKSAFPLKSIQNNIKCKVNGWGELWCSLDPRRQIGKGGLELLRRALKGVRRFRISPNVLIQSEADTMNPATDVLKHLKTKFAVMASFGGKSRMENVASLMEQFGYAMPTYVTLKGAQKICYRLNSLVLKRRSWVLMKAYERAKKAEDRAKESMADEVYHVKDALVQDAVGVSDEVSHGKYAMTQDIGRVAEVLEAEFPNGVRLGSIIDRNKVKRAWEERFGETPPSIDWDASLKQAGIIHEGKAFPRPSGENSPVDFILSLVEKAHGIFYYDALFEKERETFIRMGIQSGDMMKSVLKEIAPDSFEYKSGHFSSKGTSPKLSSKLRKAFNEKDRWSRAELEDRFPYVPFEKIRFEISRKAYLVNLGNKTYGHTAAILIDKEEGTRNAESIKAEVEGKGFCSLANYSFARSLELNGDVKESAVEDKFFYKYLSETYDRHGAIICRKGAECDPCFAMREFCRSHEEISTRQLSEAGKEYGMHDIRQSLKVAHETMVRVSEDRFVTSSIVRFDVKGCDAAIDALMPRCGIMPLCGVKSFITFPVVSGFPWNDYMLESFLRRESEGFGYALLMAYPALNAIGGVIRKSRGFASVDEAFAQAVIAAGVPPNADEVGEFLMKERYIYQRQGAEKRIAELARQMMAREAPNNGATGI